MGTPDPSSRASQALAFIAEPRTVDEVMAHLCCDRLLAYRAIHSLRRHKRARRVYPTTGAVGVPHYVASDAGVGPGWLEVVEDPTEELPSLSFKTLLRTAFNTRKISKDVTQTKVAEDAGMAQSHVSAALRDNGREPDAVTVWRILTALGYSLTLVDVQGEKSG